MTLDIYKQIGNSLNALEKSLRISISNADNFNTPGFKYSFASFTTVFSQVMFGGDQFRNPQTIAGSMTLGSTTTDYSQGNIGFGTEMDMAISGEGFFIMSQSAAEFQSSDPQVYTRAGRFGVDNTNTYVVDAFGRKVFGYKLNAQGEIENRTLVPIETGGNIDVGFTDTGILVSGFKANADAISAGTPAPETTPLYKVALTSFQNKQGLIIVEGGALQSTVSSGDALEHGQSGQGIYGNVLGSSLEASNIDVAKVALDMALLNRGFSAIQGVIDDVNKVTKDLISKLL